MFLLIPIVMIVAGLVLRMGMALVYGVRGPAFDDTIHPVVNILAWMLVGGGLTVWCLLPLAGSVGALAICVMLWVIIGFAVVDAVRSAREMHRRTNARLLAIAHREGQLREATELLTGVPSGWFVDDATRQLCYDLYAGTPLYESVARNKGALPREATAYAAIGSLASAEPDALEELSQPDDPQLATAWRSWFDYLAYTVAIVLTMGILLSLFTIFIVPQFAQVFAEFALELPPATEVLVYGFGGGATWGLLAICMGLVLLGLFVAGVLYLLDMPVLRSFSDLLFLRLHTASALRMLALAIAHRAELPRAIYALSVTHPVRIVRSRLSRAYQDIAAGQPWADVLTQHRLLATNEKGLVETAEAVGNLPWALRQIATRRESRLAGQMNFIGRLTFPVLVLAISLMVAGIVIALFVPLVKLVEGLS